MPRDDNTIVISHVGELLRPGTRRSFLRIMGAGGVAVLLPSVFASCDDDDDPLAPGSGDTVTIDFAAAGDVGVLNYAYALEQLEADFYTRVVDNFSGAGFSAAEQRVLTDIRNHEVIHREFFRAALGSSAIPSLSTTYGGLNFRDRGAVLDLAITFEDLGVAAYNGAGQYLTVAANLVVAGKIVSVEARHASTLRDIRAPKTNAFAPDAFDDALPATTVAAAAQDFIVQELQATNVPNFVAPA